MRIGCFGGSFDPVHLGHLVLAESCREALRLDVVRFIVAGVPPHKASRTLAGAPDRLAMVRLAIAGHPAFLADDREIRRESVSWTIDTIRELRAEHPGDELFWLIGADTLPELPSWREASALLDLVTIATASRPGSDPEAALQALLGPFGPARVRRLRDHLVPMPLVGISSTAVRSRAVSGRSLRYLVPQAVARHIEASGLYRTPPADGARC
ncbi:MAG: nicotinate-nucleotide adenylyltransferase [Planctomycetes bacterium]|jgi:nicotinate-nucleotide adenylyltransferase|nr:nicotinate-nucleotide adenylyltransferase [Planctomycetota bacterium]